MRDSIEERQEIDEAENITEPTSQTNDDEKIKSVDFQTTVDEWATKAGGNRSVIVYDLERDETVASYSSQETYNTASLYKLFVVYEGYRRMQSGEWKAEDPAGATGYTMLECLDLAIRESNSACAETLWAKIGHKNLDKIIKRDFDIKNSVISDLMSNPEDIVKMMKVFYKHNDITDETLVSRMRDSFLNQPVKDGYDWRQGLPSGFSAANVYNKVGWDYDADSGRWNIYHDAAVVEFPEENKHFVVVVMTNYVPFEKIRELGKMLEMAYYRQL